VYVSLKACTHTDLPRCTMHACMCHYNNNSIVPGTTLDFLRIDLGDNACLYDTPGLILPHQLTSRLKVRFVIYVICTNAVTSAECILCDMGATQCLSCCSCVVLRGCCLSKSLDSAINHNGYRHEHCHCCFVVQLTITLYTLVFTSCIYIL
jgi:hypothetical protein